MHLLAAQAGAAQAEGEAINLGPSLTGLGRRAAPPGGAAVQALDAGRDQGLRPLDGGHLFGGNTTRLGLRKGAWLRGYAYAFIETFVPTLTREVVEQAVRQGVEPE